MNKPNNKLNAFLALFINKSISAGQRPDIVELDKWRLGKVKGKRAEEIKQYIANDEEVYRWWNQLRQEAKTTEIKEKSFNIMQLLQSFSQFVFQPKAVAPAVLTVFVAYLLVSILQTPANNILMLANQDIEHWQQLTQKDTNFQLGMTRQWQTEKKRDVETSDNIKNYQIGLNQFLKKPIKIKYSSIKLCATKDIVCNENKTVFTTLGQWVSKANVICQQVNETEKNNIENRLNLWKENMQILTQSSINNVFNHWESTSEKIDPCEKIQQLIILGAQS